MPDKVSVDIISSGDDLVLNIFFLVIPKIPCLYEREDGEKSTPERPPAMSLVTSWRFTWTILVLTIGSINAWSSSPISNYRYPLKRYFTGYSCPRRPRSRSSNLFSSLGSRFTYLFEPAHSPSVASFGNFGRLFTPRFLPVHIHRYVTKSVTDEVVTAFNYLSDLLEDFFSVDIEPTSVVRALGYRCRRSRFKSYWCGLVFVSDIQLYVCRTS